MRLKLVIASMGVLGLISTPIFAATTTATTTTTTTTTTKPLHHKHHKRHHVVSNEYKDMGVLPVQPAPVIVCAISHSAMIMDGMTQSMNRSMPSPCNPGWFNRIQLSGGVNIDFGKFGNRNGNFMGENYQRLSLNDAYLNVGAMINDWTKAFASISYNTATINDPTAATGTSHVSEYSAAYSNNASSGSNNTLQLEQAYATFGNFDVTPFFIQLGKQFQDFSRYEIHPITASLTQVMSETLATSGKVGFIANGFSGSVTVFDDPLSKVGQSKKPTNYGAALGYDQPSDVFGWDIGAGYLYDLAGANDVAYSVNQFNIAAGNGIGFNRRTSATALYGDINTGPFVINARYTSALQNFNPNDLPKNGVADTTAGIVNSSASGAKPWAAGVQAGYGFEGWDRNQNVYLGYQASREAAGLLLPKSRWLVGYGIDAFGKNTNVAAEWDHDMAYNVANGGSGNNTNLVSLRASVKFG